jgi:hypothetical protein
MTGFIDTGNSNDILWAANKAAFGYRLVPKMGSGSLTSFVAPSPLRASFVPIGPVNSFCISTARSRQTAARHISLSRPLSSRSEPGYDSAPRSLGSHAKCYNHARNFVNHLAPG